MQNERVVLKIIDPRRSILSEPVIWQELAHFSDVIGNILRLSESANLSENLEIDGVMQRSQIEKFAKTKMTGKFYGAAIDYKDTSNGPRLKFTYNAFPKGYTRMIGIDLFYRWNW